MFGSAALDTAIGLTMMFFIVSLAASTIVEVYARLLSKRAKNLERAIGQMLAGATSEGRDTKAERGAIEAALNTFRGTSVYDSIRAASGKTFLRKKYKRPSYMSASAFADAVAELAVDEHGNADAFDDLPEGLKKRLRPLLREVRTDTLALKAGLEDWFDSVMARLEGSYKRWTTAILFVVALAVAIVANAGVFGVAESLWSDTATREAVAEEAGRATSSEDVPDVASVGAAVDQLESLGLPVGWSAEGRAAWSGESALPWEWSVKEGQFVMLAGWLTTAMLTLLGATFWFDVLTKLVSLRSSGKKPATAADDPRSATTGLQVRTAGLFNAVGAGTIAGGGGGAGGAGGFDLMRGTVDDFLLSHDSERTDERTMDELLAGALRAKPAAPATA